MAEKEEYVTPTFQIKEVWKKEQLKLREKMIIYKDDNKDESPLKDITYIGGVDISFVKSDHETAFASLVVCDFPELKVVYQKTEKVFVVHNFKIKLNGPYIAGFLGFREVPPLMKLWNDLLEEKPKLKPDVLITDGNGTHHHRGFGLACHFGVLADVPCIGCAKNLLFVPNGMNKDQLKEKRSELTKLGDTIKISEHGVALIPTKKSKNPIFVSPGHKTSLKRTIEIVLACCKYRIPEPVRQADLGSRQVVRAYEKRLKQKKVVGLPK